MDDASDIQSRMTATSWAAHEGMKLAAVWAKSDRLWDDLPMKRSVGLVALVLALVGIVVMMLPTLEVRWAIDPSLGEDLPVSRHSWFDPMLVGIARFDAPLALLAGLVGAILLVYGLRRDGPTWAAITLLAIAAILPLIGVIVYDSLGPVALWAPITMAASAVTAALSRGASHSHTPQPAPIAG